MTIVRLGKSGLPNLLMNNLAIAGFRDIPAMSLDFTDPSDTLLGTVTFTRASAGTRVNKLGLIESLTNDKPRFDYDPVTLSARGLLIEEQRTNSILQSQTMSVTWIGAGAPAAPTHGTDIVGPDGVAGSGYALSFPAVSAAQFSTFKQSVTVTAVPWTFSIWLKGAVGGERLYIYGNPDLVSWIRQEVTLTTQWVRYSITGTPTAAAWNWSIGADLRDAGQTATNALSLYAYGAQLEAGAFPTSYIPTTTAAVTRAADVASMTGTNFSNWFNATEGTFVVANSWPYGTVPSVTLGCMFASDGSNVNRIGVAVNGGNIYGIATVGGTPGSITETISPAITTRKTALAYSQLARSSSVNGRTVLNSAVDLGGIFSACNRLTLGTYPDTLANFINGHIQRLTYYNKRLPDATLQALST